MQFDLKKDRHLLKSLMLFFLDDDNAYTSLLKIYIHLWKIIDGYEISIMELKKCINGGIDEATKKLCASID